MSKNDVKEFGQMTLDNSKRNSKVQLLSMIGEIEGHEVLSGNSKTTKYEHVIPSLAEIEDDKTIEGLLILINTIGGDVESGLAIAEMIASISKPTVSLVLGTVGIVSVGKSSAGKQCRKTLHFPVVCRAPFVKQSAVDLNNSVDIGRALHSSLYFERSNAAFDKFGNIFRQSGILQTERIGAVILHSARLSTSASVTASTADHSTGKALTRLTDAECTVYELLRFNG